MSDFFLGIALAAFVWLGAAWGWTWIVLAFLAAVPVTP